MAIGMMFLDPLAVLADSIRDKLVGQSFND